MTASAKLSTKVVGKLPGIGGRVRRAPVVAVVKLHGVITPTPTPWARGTISLSTVGSAVKRAFERERLVAVALDINSPGGAATQSALVAERICELAAEQNVPVLAFCADVAASGGYWLACAADEIYAHSTSMVGSIGVVSASFGLTGLLDRFGVERRVHTAGRHKVRLDPFRPEREEDVQWLRGLQDELHQQFVSWVVQRRGERLTESEDLFSGEVWTGQRAHELGLVDGIGTLSGIIGQRYPDAKVVVSEGRRTILTRLGLGGSGAGLLGFSPADRLLAGLEAIEARASWSRFGL